MKKAVVFEVYLCIGITSLCLYSNSRKAVFQDGIFHKILAGTSCRWEKSQLPVKNPLTENGISWYALSVGAVLDRPFFFLSKTVANGKRIC